MAYAIVHVGGVLAEDTLLPLASRGRLLDEWSAIPKLSGFYGGIHPVKSAPRQEISTGEMGVYQDQPIVPAFTSTCFL